MYGKAHCKAGEASEAAGSFCCQPDYHFVLQLFSPLLPAQQALEAEERKIKSMTRQLGSPLLLAAGGGIVFESARRVAQFAGDLSTPVFFNFILLVFLHGERGGMTLWNELSAFIPRESPSLHSVMAIQTPTIAGICNCMAHRQQAGLSAENKQRSLEGRNAHNGCLQAVGEGN